MSAFLQTIILVEKTFYKIMKKKLDGNFVITKKERKIYFIYIDAVVCESDFKNNQIGLVGLLKFQILKSNRIILF